MTGMVLGIVNNEVELDQCFNSSLITVKREDFNCILSKVSCRFIQQINSSVAVKVNLTLRFSQDET